MKMQDEGVRIRRSVHLTDEAWHAARRAALRAGADRESYLSTSAWIEEVILRASREVDDE